MFKKLYRKIDEVKTAIKVRIEDCCENDRYIHDDVQKIYNKVYDLPELNRMSKTIASQQRTIEQLTNALKDKYEHGLFVYSEDGRIVKAIQDGEEISLDRMTYFGVEWSVGKTVGVSIERR